MTKLRSGRKTAAAGGDDEDGVPKSSATRKRAQPTASATGGKAPRKKADRKAALTAGGVRNPHRFDAEAVEKANKFNKAKPSICKAAEELVCPILQGLPIDPVMAADGQIYEREEIAKYLDGKEDDDEVLSPVTKQPFESRAMYPAVHVRNTIEHLVESGIIEGELANTWKEQMAKKRRSEKVLKKTKKNAENGDTTAMYELGFMYEYGEDGLKEDEEEAYKWYKKAADAGNVMGTAALGEYLLNGWGVKKNWSEGLIMLVTAAKDGSDYACFLLGETYFHGRCGVEVNYFSAKYWLEKALSAEARSCEHSHLTQESIENAERLKAECIAYLDV